MKITIAQVANSSMMDFEDIFNNFSEVSTMKHSASKLEEAFKMCGDFSLSFAMKILYGVTITKKRPCLKEKVKLEGRQRLNSD
jgi:hypothetical protein